MKREQIEVAITEGIPFVIRMADGLHYDVVDRFRIALGRSTVIVVDEEDAPHILPMQTMTGLTYLKGTQGS